MGAIVLTNCFAQEILLNAGNTDLLKGMVDKAHKVNNFLLAWPPVLKLLYTFLYEEEYLNDPAFIIEVIDDLDPQFIDALRNRFS